MVRCILFATLLFFACSCNQDNKPDAKNKQDKPFSELLEKYFDSRMQLFPLEATFIGDNRYNDRLPVDFTDSYNDSVRSFYTQYATELKKYSRDDLNANDKISYDIFKREIDIDIEGLNFHANYIPFHQFGGLPFTMGQLGSGEGAQPFKTMDDYTAWITRATAFGAWADSAIIYFKKGMSAGYVLPHSLVVKMIPQMEAMVVADPEKSLSYGPVRRLPAGFDTAAAANLKTKYRKLIAEQLVPAYKKLGDFLKKEYLPVSRASSGISGLPDSTTLYPYLVRQQTTTSKTPDEIYRTGLIEVARIRGIMDSVKNAVGYKGDLAAFFEYMKTDKKFMPYKTPQEVLAAFEAIHQRMEPQLKTMFTHTPKTRFEIRQTEAFRAASASAEYNQGSADGSRPGIFYVPILDAKTFNTTSGMESLFLHEAIPGHHYQISLQQEDTLLPKFRRFGGNNAYVEGWALYCESLGKELGLYTDPYQYMGALGDEIHRAIRLVVDVSIHTKGMSREAAIKYMMDNEPISKEGATAEIERYMAIPGQALGYKIGAMKIRELREKYRQQLGAAFHISAFHDEILKDGAMPLEVLEHKMDAWAAAQK